MSNQKILSICVPTYNRSRFLKEQLIRFSAFDSSIYEQVEILISNNCSTDNTKEVVKSFLGEFPFIYHENEENQGMDGNFLTCFELATGKYIWLLGDDDFIEESGLKNLLSYLDKKEEYGLVHINMIPTKNDIGSKIYLDMSKFLDDIGIWITFISGNIVNRKYVGTIDLRKYMGTWFLIMPLYITCAYKEEKNLMVYDRLFDGGKDAGTNGGYNIFDVFVKNYLNIFKEYLDLGIITDEIYKKEKKYSFDFIMTYYNKLIIKKEKSRFKVDNAKDTIIEYFGENRFYLKIFILMFLNFFHYLKSKFFI
jgi:abequosyltransferase